MNERHTKNDQKFADFEDPIYDRFWKMEILFNGF